MPPAAQNPNLTPEQIEQQKRELNANYIIAVQNLAVTSSESQKALVNSWSTKDKLINDFFTFSLVTLGVAVTILTAKSSLISSKGLFFTSFGLLSFVVAFSSFSRLYLDYKSSRTTKVIFNNFNDAIAKIDVFRLAPENLEAKVKMEESIANANTYVPQETWLVKYAQVVIVSVFVVAFLLFVLSMAISVNVPNVK